MPAFWTTFAVKAGDYQDALLLHFEKYSVREARNASAPHGPMNNWELLGMCRYCLDGSLDRQRETIPKLRASFFVPGARFFQFFKGFW
jgi:hypothetical protein